MGSSIALFSTLLSLGAAWLYLSPSRRQEQRNTFGFLVTATLGLHTLLVLSNLALHRPPNLFTRLGIPINSPVDRISSLLMREAGFNTMGERGAVIIPREIPKDVEALLTRLGVHGSRDTYVRYVCVSSSTGVAHGRQVRATRLANVFVLLLGRRLYNSRSVRHPSRLLANCYTTPSVNH